MGYHLFREVKRHAPADLDAGELALLLILADEANDDTRECFPGADELCAHMRMSWDGISRILKRLAERGLDVRVPVGKDSRGRVVYAYKGTRTTYKIPRFKGQTVGGALDSERSDSSATNSVQSSDARPTIGAQRSDAGPSKVRPQSDPSPQFPHEEDPHLLPPQRILRSAGITLGDEDERRFIDWIKTTRKPRSSAWWRKVADEGDLPGHVADWREQCAQSAPGPLTGLPPWCGQCGDGFGAARTNPRFRTLSGQPCPTCHPDAARAA